VTDVQILTIAIALGTSSLAVLVGVLLNNSRLNDVKELLTAKMSAGNADLRLVIERNHSELFHQDRERTEDRAVTDAGCSHRRPRF
jgi:hypothetical protein